MVLMTAYKKIRQELLESDLPRLKKARVVAILDGINEFVDVHDRANVDQANLAASCGCKPTRVKKATRELEELGYLERIRTKRSTDKRYHWNAYQLVYPPIVADSESIVANHVGENGWIYNPTWEFVKPLLVPGSVHIHERHGSMEVAEANDQRVVLLDAGGIRQEETAGVFLDGYGMSAVRPE